MAEDGSEQEQPEGEKTGILGKLGTVMASAVPARVRLLAAAELHHAFSFDEVDAATDSLAYEPRCSASCAKCRAIWIGSKAGELLRLKLAPGRIEAQRRELGGVVRTLAHVDHDGLIVGLDTGHVVVLDARDLSPRGFCHLAKAGAGRDGQPLALEPGQPPLDGPAPDPLLYGITAIAVLPGDHSWFVDLVIGTRQPELDVVRLGPGTVTIRGRHPLSGWSRCLTITGATGKEVLVCTTRGGEIYEWPCGSLDLNPKSDPSGSVSARMAPAAVAPARGERLQTDGHALLIGASDGLHIRRGRSARPIQVAATRSAVLSLATRMVPGIGGSKAYVALGLEDGHLRVLEEVALVAMLDGGDVGNAHDFRVPCGAAVLALEILDGDEPGSCFVLAALRDHRLRLFHVRSRDELLRDIKRQWHHAIGPPDAITGEQLDDLFRGEPAGIRRNNALRFLLADEVLPRWVNVIDGSHAVLVDRACSLARGADDKVLYRLSARMSDIAGNDAIALIRISMACLVAMSQRDMRLWRAFVSYHLAQFHVFARRAEPNEVSRLQHWARFVRKYMLFGETFADKRFRIEELVRSNQHTHKYLDALIYAAQLEQQRYDLLWSTVACRDEHGRPQDIVRVDLLDDVAIVVTAAAEVVFLTVEGKPLQIMDHGESRDRLAPGRGNGPTGVIRTRATRFVRKHASWIRIALSWEGGAEPARGQVRVTIFDLARHVERSDDDDVTRQLELEQIHEVRHTMPRRAGGSEVEVHGLVGLSAPAVDGKDLPAAFLAGLDSNESPLALLQPSPEGVWTLSPLAMARGDRPQDALPSSSPIRAVAVLELDVPTPASAVGAEQRHAKQRHYLGAAGAADGSLRLVAFDLAGNVLAEPDEPTLLVYPINDIALASRHGDLDYGQVCYAGTETGLSLSLLVNIDRERKRIITRQLWRDLHGSAVIAVRPTVKPVRPSEVLYDHDVVFVATKDGHLSIYHASRSDVAQATLTRHSWNYYFEGMRFDRIDLAEGLTSWAIRRSRSGFLAAYPHGELRFGRLHAPRESSPRGSVTDLEEIFERVRRPDGVVGVLANQFFGPNPTDEQRLEICGMIRIGGGALRSYVLRKQLEQLPWDDLDGPALESRLTEHLAGLGPEVREERDRIKVVIEMTSNRILDRHPGKFLDAYRQGDTDDRIASFPRVRWACEFLAGHLLRAAVLGQPGAVRMRMAIMNALLRVNVFWHAALDEQSARHIPRTLREVLTACLRDEDKRVRVEALRAVAVVLRNISLMLTLARIDDQRDRAAETDADRSIDDGAAPLVEVAETLRTGFFPLGLRTIQWLVDVILDNYARYRRQGEPVLLSTPWSYITVLVAVIRLFPGDTLGLCEQISRRGLGDCLAIIIDRLRGERVDKLCKRIRELWIVPALHNPGPHNAAQARSEFKASFGECNIAEALGKYGIAPSDADHARATELLHVYRRLALLWNVNLASDIADVPARLSRSSELPLLTGNLAGLEKILEAFVAIARTQRDDQAATLRAQLASAPRDDKLPAAVRRALERVVEHWQGILEPRIPAPGDEVLKRKVVGVPVEHGRGLIYEVDGKLDEIVKVMRDPRDDAARLEFNRNARLSREMGERYPNSFLRVYEIEPTNGRAVMQRSKDAKEFLDKLKPGKRADAADAATRQLTRALRCLHEEGLVHGDLRAENVFVAENAAGTTFRLGDLHIPSDDAQDSMAALRIPNVLEVPKNGRGRWIDLVSLTLLLHEILTGERLQRDANAVALSSATTALAGRRDCVADLIARMLGNTPYRSAEELEAALDPALPYTFQRKPVAGRPRASFDVFISYDSREDMPEARALADELTKRCLIPYLDALQAVPEDWARYIASGMGDSRAFAVLVGAKFRGAGNQAREANEARDQAQRHRLPFKVFLLGHDEPGGFANDHPSRVDGPDAKARAAQIAEIMAASFASADPRVLTAPGSSGAPAEPG